MTIFRYIFLLLLVAMANPVSAQAIGVRTGDHRDYTRVVLDLQPDTDWKISQDQFEIVISLDNDGSGFDISNVFKRISRDRIFEIKESPERLSLEILLNCQCKASWYETSENMLVIDVKDPTYESVRRPNENFTFNSADRSFEIGPELTRIKVLPSISLIDTEYDPLSSLEETNEIHLRFESIFDQANAGILGRSTVLDNLEERIPVGGAYDEFESMDTEQYYTADGIAIKHSATPQNSQCRKSDADHLITDLATQSIQKSHLTQLSQSYDESDKPKKEILTNVVTGLLSQGFGVEARQIIDKYGITNSAALSAISYIVDHEVDPSMYFDGQGNCFGASGLWSVASVNKFEKNELIDNFSLLAEFKKLPESLQRSLGATIINRLVASGYHDSARDLLSYTNRLLADFVEINEGMKQKDVSEPNWMISEEDSGRIPNSDQSKVDFDVISEIDSMFDNGVEVPAEMITLIEALAVEYGDLEHDGLFWISEIKSNITVGDFSKAFEVLDRTKYIPDDTKSLALNLIYEGLSRQGNQIFLLKQLLSRPSSELKLVEDSILIGLVEVMLRFGNAKFALSLLELNDEIDELLAYKSLKAKALLQLGMPKEAEISIVGLEGADFRKIRAFARRKMGDYEYSQRSFIDLGLFEDAEISAWLGENWADFDYRDDSIRSKIAKLDEISNDGISQSATNLESGARLIINSNETREILEALLLETLF